MKTRHGFTLIELLIVVAIIAILAAIAVPNFLEAQTRAKVSRTKADQRTLATALETYIVDWNAYPLCNNFAIPGVRTATGDTDPDDRVLERLSTPIAYITTAFLEDPFETQRRLVISQPGDLPPLPGNYFEVTEKFDGPQYRAFTYQSWNNEERTTIEGGAFESGESSAKSWLVQGIGPDRTYINLGGVLDNFTGEDTALILYDPTNGTISFGSIFRVGGSPGGDPNPRPADAAYGGGFFAGVSRAQ